MRSASHPAWQRLVRPAWRRGAVLLLLMATAPLPTPAPGKPEGAQAAARGRDRAPATAPTALTLQLEMAASDSFYLEIDPGQRVMRLKLAGVALRDYPLLALQQGTPRLAFVRMGAALAMAGGVWPAGALDPPRPEIRLEVRPPDPNAPDSTLPVFQPPPSIEEMPVPETYSIRFAGGFTLTVTSPRPAATGVRGVAAALRDRWRAVREAVVTRRTHLRIVIERVDAQHLFRSLPPGTYLLVLPS